MKRIRFLFMAVFLLFAVTGLRATIPDLKENSKTEKLKDEFQSVKMVKAESQMNFQINKDYNFEFVGILIVPEVENEKQSFDYAAKNTTSEKRQTQTFRKPRDGISWNK